MYVDTNKISSDTYVPCRRIHLGFQAVYIYGVHVGQPARAVCGIFLVFEGVLRSVRQFRVKEYTKDNSFCVL